MNGIDWLASESSMKYRIYLEYISCKLKKVNSSDRPYRRISPDWKPEQVYLKFKNRDDDYEYFGYVCKQRPYDNIWDYFKGEQPLQNDRFESKIGLFA